MHLRKTLLLILACAFLFSCRKENNSTTTGQQDDCVSSRSSKAGNIIEGQYIIAYKPSSLDERTISTQRLSQMSEDVLLRNSIRSSAIEKTFLGGPGGFVARLSAKEVTSLQS